jgi:hypothetical protein
MEATPSHGRAVVVERPPRSRSATTNQPLRRANGNTATGRRVRDLYRAFLQHMGNPADTVTQSNALNAAELAVAVEQARLPAIRGEAVDIDALVRLSNLADRAVRRLGIRPGKASVPTLAEHLARRAAERVGERSNGPA